jgi:predicted DNA-binding protein
MNEQQKTQELLEQTLDNLCKHTGRDIYVILPEKVEERNPYLINEIKKTLDKIK